MQLPGLDELESSIARVVDELGRLKTENSELRERFRALGKEIDDLATLIDGVESGQKIDSKTRKRMGQKLKVITDGLS